MQPAGEVEADGGVAKHLVEDALGGVDIVNVAEGSARRGVDVEAGAAAEQSDTEEMRAVGDDNDGVEVVRGSDLCKLCYLLLRVEGVGLGDDVVEGYAVGEEVVAADAPFSAAGVLLRAATEGDDGGRDAVVVESDGFVEARVKDGRGTAGVLSGTEDGDGVGTLCVVDVRGVLDLAVEPDEPAGGDDEEDEECPAEQARAEAAARSRVPGSGAGTHRKGQVVVCGIPVWTGRVPRST